MSKIHYYWPIFKIANNTSTEYNYSLSDCHTMGSLILKKFSLLTIKYIFPFPYPSTHPVLAMYIHYQSILFYYASE